MYFWPRSPSNLARGFFVVTGRREIMDRAPLRPLETEVEACALPRRWGFIDVHN